MTPYGPGNLEAAKPDLVVVGNVIRRVNPEATAVRERGLPAMSFPAAFGALFLRGRHPVVVVGTHGKTTTSALTAHMAASGEANRRRVPHLDGIERHQDPGHALVSLEERRLEAGPAHSTLPS